MRPACGTSGTTRSRISPGPGGCPRRSWPGPRSGRRSTSTRSRRWASSWGAVRDGRALFSGGLRNMFSLADLKMERLLGTFDEWARAGGYDAAVGPPERFAPTGVPGSARLQLDLSSGEIRAIVWATGFRPDYGWLDVAV